MAMGYSSRYHAASLAAVFVALAIGILIGAALGSDVVSGTAEDLEEDLGEDLDRLRADNAELQAQLEADRRFEGEIYPTVVEDRLAGQEVALVALGDVDTPELTDALEDALGPAGGSLAEVAEVRIPPDVSALLQATPSPGDAGRRDGALAGASRAAGRRLVGAGELGPVRAALLTGFSGDAEGIDAAVVVRAPRGELAEREARVADTLEAGLLEGMEAAGTRLVGAERTDDEPSQVEFFSEAGIASVDNLDTVAGKVALVYALGGADGAFGTKETADGLLPDLLSRGG